MGYVLHRIRFIEDNSWQALERLTYFILFPALLIHTLGNQSISGTRWQAIVLVVVSTLLLTSLVLVIWFKLQRRTTGPTFTSIFQGGVRFNTYIAFAVAQAIYGAEGLAIASLAAGFMIVLINLLCISAFSIWGRSAIRGIKPFIRTVAYNPLIVGCAIGWFLSLSGIGVSPLADSVLEIIGRAALPFGLLAVGAALRLKSIRGHMGAITISSLAQYLLKPLMVAGLVQAFALPPLVSGVLLISFMVPTASSAYILARQLGGDTETMASIISFQTLIAFVSMPLTAHFLL